MWKTRLLAGIVFAAGCAIGFFVFSTEPALRPLVRPAAVEEPAGERFAFKLGLDLSGGTRLIYRADVSGLPRGEAEDSMDALRDVIERRVNLFGVSEPTVVVEEPTLASGGEHRLSVDLPGITDIEEAARLIGQTPLLEFKTEAEVSLSGADEDASVSIDELFESTPLTGRYLERAVLEFDPTTGSPLIGLRFDAEGAALFEEITRENVGKVVAIFLDGAPISTPVVNEAISGGVAQITGSFTPVEARELVGRLNSGALPVPIELVSTDSVGPSLGAVAVERGVRAVMIGFLAMVAFFILWYRLLGLMAALSLVFYVALVLALFKLIPVTLTAAGIAGFIISIGIAVDANVLIFERIREELRLGSGIAEAVRAGFGRAWTSVRDSNTSSIITGIILYWFGTSLIKGFALTFIIGVFSSLVVAASVTRLFIYTFSFRRSAASLFFFGAGFRRR